MMVWSGLWLDFGEDIDVFSVKKKEKKKGKINAQNLQEIK